MNKRLKKLIRKQPNDVETRYRAYDHEVYAHIWQKLFWLSAPSNRFAQRENILVNHDKTEQMSFPRFDNHIFNFLKCMGGFESWKANFSW